ncbi:MAG: ABC transporter permease [Halobacteriales archaeon]
MSATAPSMGIVGHARLLEAVARKRVVLRLRYPLNTLSQFLTLYLLFLVIFLGGRAVAPATITDSLAGIIVGYLLWTMAMTAFSGLAWNVTREAQWGTLEQLFMSPFGFGRVMAVKLVVNVVESFLWGVSILVLMILTTGETVAIDPVTVVPLLLLAVAPAAGMGFLFGGLAVRFKRIENAFQLVQFVLIGLIAAPVTAVPLAEWLPLAQGSAMLQAAMAEGIAIWDLPAADLAILAVTAVGYLLAGFLAFQWCQRWARRAGVMGHY